MGEGRVDKKNLVPPPLHPLPRGEGRFLGSSKMLEINSQTSMCKNLNSLERTEKMFDDKEGYSCGM